MHALTIVACDMVNTSPYEIKSKPKWEQAFRTNIEYTDWNKIFTLPRKTTIDSQTRIFQYKILHRILPTNDLLHKYNLRDNPMCEQCPVTIDTLEHTFHLCPRIKQVWYDMADWLFPEIDLFQYINAENIIVGIYKENKFLENTIILLVKRFIYINKCKKTRITSIGIKLYLRHIMALEVNVKSQELKILHIRKWDLIRRKLENV